jgi:translation initiation factor IF-3
VLRFRDVRVIDANGDQMGILQSRQALAHAKEQGLDLVMVSPSANPPVCKILDYGKFKYLTGKQARETKKKQSEVKGIKISPRIAEHDLAFLLKNTIRFLGEGHKVKVTCQFRAREVTHPEIGRKKLERMAGEVADIAVVERPPSLDGKLMIMVLVPKPSTKPSTGKQKNAKAENKQDRGEAVQDKRDGKDPAAEVAQQPPVPAQEREPEAQA